MLRPEIAPLVAKHHQHALALGIEDDSEAMNEHVLANVQADIQRAQAIALAMVSDQGSASRPAAQPPAAAATPAPPSAPVPVAPVPLSFHGA